MNVVITGGTGHVGKAAVERLVKHGHRVRVLGRRPDMNVSGAEYVQCDIVEFDSLCRQFSGADVVVHLAAVPSPAGAPGPALFEVNAVGTFNVFEACARAGIHRIVQASSINAFGCFFNLGELRPKYFPIDEDHPRITTDPYSFSKSVCEDIADYYWRRDGISSVSLRFPWVHPADEETLAGLAHRRAAGQALVAELMTLPEPVRRTRIDAVREWSIAYRKQRPLEFGSPHHRLKELDCPDSQLAGMYFGGAYDLFVVVDARDAAQAIEKGLMVDYAGSHTLFINGSRNVLGCRTRTLAELFFPEVNEWRHPVADREALVSIQRARELLGFEPEFEAP